MEKDNDLLADGGMSEVCMEGRMIHGHGGKGRCVEDQQMQWQSNT